MAHHHHHARGTGWVLRLSLAATLAFTAFEIFAGLRSHSLSLLSDAGHNFTDALALLLAAVGVYLQGKPANQSKTYGYGRAGVIAAFVNAATLILVSLIIFWEAAGRLLHPEPLNDRVMMWVALAALVLNGAIVIALNRGKKGDINIRAAMIHMAGDAVGALAIIMGAFVIRYTGRTYVDPLLSIVLGLFIIYTAWDIIHESWNILLEGLPRGIKLSNVTHAMGAVEGVIDVHDLHIWSLGSSTHALSSHVLIDDMPPSASECILKRIQKCWAASEFITPPFSLSTYRVYWPKTAVNPPPAIVTPKTTSIELHAESIASNCFLKLSANSLSGAITKTVSSPAIVPTTSLTSCLSIAIARVLAFPGSVRSTTRFWARRISSRYSFTTALSSGPVLSALN